MSSPYCSRYACAPTSSAFLATPYGAFVSSGIAVPELLLAERDRRELRVRADGAGDARACACRGAAPARARARPSSGSRTSSGPGSRGWRRCRRPRPRGGTRAPGSRSSNRRAVSAMSVRSVSARRGTTTSCPSSSQPLDEVRAEEAAAAGDENAHRGRVLRRMRARVDGVGHRSVGTASRRATSGTLASRSIAAG